MSDILERARDWVQGDPDAQAREEITALIERVESGEPAASAELAERFAGPLAFGTAGLRGVMGAGETRMNRAVVIRTTAGLVAHLLEVVPDARARGVCIGRDARARSDEFLRDVAEVVAAAGMTVHLLPEPAPTPLVAFAVRHLGAAAGIVITASHNPPAYNGYKVYLGDGAQIIPPHDSQIAACIGAAPPATQVPRKADAFEPHPEIEAAYLDAIDGLSRGVETADQLSIAYTALHGVGERLARAALVRAGFSNVVSVAEQSEPDGRFPTLDFPNPEDPAVMARVLDLARSVDADLVLANDPDADRLAVAVRDREGAHVTLTGNEIGVLLGHHLLTHGETDPNRLVISTVVSSVQLARIARDLGVRHAETLTGFKWIARCAMTEARDHGARFVFGYEEAIGYTIGTVVRDKDGIGAAVVFAELAAACKARGETVLDQLSRIRRAHGFYFSRPRSLTLPGREGAERIKAIMAAFRGASSAQLAGCNIKAVWDLATRKKRLLAGGEVAVEHMPEADVLVFELGGGGRACVRPSGTEPKIKLYLEVCEPAGEGESDEVVKARANERLRGLERALFELAGLDPD